VLSKILEELRNFNGVMSLSELSRRLGVERSALDGMMETLIRQGKIKELSCPAAACSGCCGRSLCDRASNCTPAKIYTMIR
jgi:hypothetical protein